MPRSWTPPDWFKATLDPMANGAEQRVAWDAYLADVREVQYHGIRTGSGPGETFVIIEWPARRVPVALSVGGQSMGTAIKDEPAKVEELTDDFGNTWEWGFSGVQAMNLSGALLTHAVAVAARNTDTSSDVTTAAAERYRGPFLEKIVSRLPRHEWTLTYQFIMEWLTLHIEADLKEMRQ